MKNLWILALFSSVFSITLTINPFRLQMVSQAENGAYDFAYDTGDGAYHIQSRDDRGTVTGKFAYVDPEGQLREIDYKADDNGFHPSGDIHPKRFANTKTNANFEAPTFDSSFTTSRTPHSEIPKELEPINEYSQAETETFVPEHVIGPVPNARVDMDSIEIDDSPPESNAKSRPIAAKPSFPIAALLSTGTLPDIDAERPPNDGAVQTSATFFHDQSPLVSGLLANPGERIAVRNIQYFTNPRTPPHRTSISSQRFGFSPVREFLNQNQRKSDDELRYTSERKITRQTTLINEEQSAKLLNTLTKLMVIMPFDDLLKALENLAVVQVQPTVAFGQPLTPEVQQIVSSVEKLLGTKTNKSKDSTDSSGQTFSDDPSLKVHQTPLLGSPLYTPVEGIREVDGEKLLHRTYVPFTRRYGYVLTQRAE